MRSQLTGLQTLIEAVPTITSAVVDAVDTLPPNESATVSVHVTGGVLHLTFGIPQGEQGTQGPAGPVTEQMLADGLDTRAHSVAGLSTLDLTADGEYQPSQLQDVANKVDQLIILLQGS